MALRRSHCALVSRPALLFPGPLTVWTQGSSHDTAGAIYDAAGGEPVQNPRSTYAVPHQADHGGVWHTAQMWLGLPTGLTKAEAAATLSGPSCTAGSFLVRSQSGGNGLALSVRSATGQVVHYRIDADGGMFTLLDTKRSEPQFTSLENLIMSYVYAGETVPANGVALTNCIPPPIGTGGSGFLRKASVYNGFGDDDGNTNV